MYNSYTSFLPTLLSLSAALSLTLHHCGGKSADPTFRLPRNHPEVLANLEDLSKCIRIMPTSGSHFTAQAPLLPVFFLGLLATDPKHKSVSKDWFEKVVETPVRSVSAKRNAILPF
jgi:hypothetical protein